MKNLIIIGGPTAVGKTDLAIWLAKKLNTEIISADSRQIYKEMLIGTARPTQEEMQGIIHHFIATKSVVQYYNASMYEQEVIHLIENLFGKYNNLIVVGGSGLYIDAIVKGIDDIPTILPSVRQQLALWYNQTGIEKLQDLVKKLDPKYFEQADINNPIRLLKALEVTIQSAKPYSSFLKGQNKKRPFNIIFIGLNRPREELYQRINQRVIKMIELGLVEEVKNLIPYKNYTALNTVGYKEIFQYLEGQITLEQAIDLIQRNTRKYARRQISWFKRYENIKWLHPEEKEKIWQYITEKIS